MSVAKPILEYIKTIKTEAGILCSTGAFRRLLPYKRYLNLVIVSLALAVIGAYLFTLELVYATQIIDLVITQGK